MSKVVDIKFDYKAIGILCLKSKEIDDVLNEVGQEKAKEFGSSATVTLRKGYGKRHRVYIDAPYETASKDNKLLKAVSK